MSGGASGLTYAEYRDRRFFPALDGIRAVAVIAVVASHVSQSDALGWFRGGRGVEWFFALSGFLITTLALREEADRGALAVKPFFVRRAFRILPLYVIALAVTAFVDMVVIRSSSATQGWRDYWPYYLTFLQDVPFHLGWDDTPFEVAWSLGVEEKFYLLWPVVGFVILKRGSRTAGTALCATALASLLVLTPASGASRLGGSYLPILCGCLAAMWLHEPRAFRLVALVPRWLLWAVALLVALPWPGTLMDGRFYRPAYAVLTAAVVAGFAVARSVPGLDSPAAQWVGRLSYAIYLFHPQVIRLVANAVDRSPLTGEAAGALAFVLVLAGSFLVANVLHRAVEQPMIFAGRRRGGRPPAAETVSGSASA